MTRNRVPLGILDLVPVVSGSDAGRALCNAMDLVQVAEQLGYRRYWFAEHHLNSGVAGSAPALLIAMAAAAITATSSAAKPRRTRLEWGSKRLMPSLTRAGEPAQAASLPGEASEEVVAASAA